MEEGRKEDVGEDSISEGGGGIEEGKGREEGEVEDKDEDLIREEGGGREEEGEEEEKEREGDNLGKKEEGGGKEDGGGRIRKGGMREIFLVGDTSLFSSRENFVFDHSSKTSIGLFPIKTRVALFEEKMG